MKTGKSKKSFVFEGSMYLMNNRRKPEISKIKNNAAKGLTNKASNQFSIS